MQFDVPGRADNVSAQFLAAWNAEIQRQYQRLNSDPGLRTHFFAIDPQSIQDPTTTNAVKWFGDPAEPVVCLDREAARLLSDWGVRGRHNLHNEYAEYTVIQQIDPATGQPRNKRVQVTTELREYWVCAARLEPDTVRAMVQSILGFVPSWQDLYDVDDPSTLTPDQREAAFSRLVAGDGQQTQPNGRLNTENALFMTHQINGLDDLIYIVMFGAKPYARRVNNQLQPATRNQIFREYGVEHLACRHADPAAAMGAQAQVFNGRTVAFANPLGVYIATFAEDVFSYQDQQLPDGWVRFSRGQQGMFQRLDFGPPDSDSAFLDEIKIEVAGVRQAVAGGYQIVQQMEVGPIVLLGPPSQLNAEDYVVLNTSTATINCREADVCPRIRRLKDEYDASHPLVQTGPRRMDPGV